MRKPGAAPIHGEGLKGRSQLRGIYRTHRRDKGEELLCYRIG